MNIDKLVLKITESDLIDVLSAYDVNKLGISGIEVELTEESIVILGKFKKFIEIPFRIEVAVKVTEDLIKWDNSRDFHIVYGWKKLRMTEI